MLCRCTGYQNIVTAVESYLAEEPAVAGVETEAEPRIATRDWIGERVRASEDERLLRGQGRFVDDVEPADLPAHGCRALPVPARAHPRHRRLARRLSSRASRQFSSGATSWRDGAEHGAAAASRRAAARLLRDGADVALFEGQPVVAVVAVDRYVAEDALDLIDVDYDPSTMWSNGSGPDAGAPVLHEQLGSNLLVVEPP